LHRGCQIIAAAFRPPGFVMDGLSFAVPESDETFTKAIQGRERVDGQNAHSLGLVRRLRVDGRNSDSKTEEHDQNEAEADHARLPGLRMGHGEGRSWVKGIQGTCGISHLRFFILSGDPISRRGLVGRWG
jgi:hypothetical protein